jgi:hypothetical protein
LRQRLSFSVLHFNNLTAIYCAMSREKLIESASAHPEIIAIALEVTLNPGRRRYYSPLVLTLADAAMQEIMAKIIAEPAASAGENPCDPGEAVPGE